MAKFHISEDGNPRPCSAADGNCPLGEDQPHFPTKVAARSAYEASLDSAVVAPSHRKKIIQETGVDPLARVKVAGRELPERVYFYETKAGIASEVKLGDRWSPGDEDFKQVVGVKTGTKNVTLTIRDATGKEKSHYVKGDTSTIYQTRKETADSKAAHATALKEQWLEERINNYEPKQPKILAELTQKTLSGQTADYWDTSSLIEAATKDKVMKDYESAVEQVKYGIANGVDGYVGEENPYSRASELLKEEYTREAVQFAGRGDSHSTSGVSNVFNQELMKAKADFIGDLRWL